MPLTRADLIVNLTFAATLAAPLISLVSFQLVRRRRYALHRNLQAALAVACWMTVLAFELHLRLSGGSGALLRQASPTWQPWARALLAIHISAAVATYALWTWLAVTSWRRYRRSLPGEFSARHRKFGKLIFAGLSFTALSATGMYLFAFVL